MTTSTSPAPIYVYEPVPTVFGLEKASGRFGNSGKKKNWHIKQGFLDHIKQIKDEWPDATIIILHPERLPNGPLRDQREAAKAKPIDQLTPSDIKVLAQLRVAMTKDESTFRYANAFAGQDLELIEWLAKDAERWISTADGELLDQIAKLKVVIDPDNERNVVVTSKKSLVNNISSNDGSQLTMEWLNPDSFEQFYDHAPAQAPMQLTN